MESLDLRLLRAHFIEEAYTLRGIYPRCSVLGLARKVGASRVTVGRRLARWRAEGFWKGRVVFPNPDALGARFQLQPLLLEFDRNRDRFEAAIREVLEPLLTFQIEGFYGVLSLTESRTAGARRQRAFQRASGCEGATPPFEIPFPGSSLFLTPRDWRIVHSLRAFPEPDWHRIAQEAGMTLRGLERRVDRLMRANALFMQPLVDFRRLPVTVAWVSLLFSQDVEPERFWTQVKELNADVLRIDPAVPPEVFRFGEGRPPAGGAVSFFLPVPSGSSGDMVRRDLARLPGALDVMVRFPTQNFAAAAGLDARIASATPSGGEAT